MPNPICFPNNATSSLSFPYHFNLPLLWFLKHLDAERTNDNSYTYPFPHRLHSYDLAAAADAAVRSQIGVFQIHKEVEGFPGRKGLARFEVNP
jgi:hypothetical protein